MAYNDDFIVKNGLVVRATTSSRYQSTSTQTGAIVTPGGLGIGQNATIGGILSVLSSATFTSAQTTDIVKILSTAVNTSTVTPVGNALQVSGGIYAQNINIGGIALVKGSRVLTVDEGFTGGQISEPLVINTTTNSTSTTTGALVTPGGIGVGRDMTVGGQVTVYGPMFTQGYQVPTLLTVATGSGLAGGATLSATNATITLSNTGVLTATGGTGISIDQATGNIVITNIGVQSINAGTDIQLSGSTGSVTITDVSTFQSVTTRGSFTNQILTLTNPTSYPGPFYSTFSNALNVLGGISAKSINVLNTSYQGGAQIVTTATINQFIGGNIYNPLHINNLTASVSTQTGALIVDGGTGIGGDVFIGKTLNVTGDTNIYGSLNVLGTYTTFTVNSTQTYIIDPMIDIGTGAGNTALTSNDGLDRGLLLHYNTGSNTTFDNHAFIGRVATTGELTFLTDIQPGGLTENITNPIAGGNYGTAKFGVLKLVGGNASSGFGSGDLQITGGAGITGNLYAGKLYEGSHRALTDVSIVAQSGIGVSVTSTSSGANVYLTNTGVLSIVAGTGIASQGSLTTGNLTLSNAGVTSILQNNTNGDIGLLWTNGAAGDVLISNLSTLQSTTGRGNTSSYQIILNSPLNSTSTSATNALYLAGKGGIYARSIMLEESAWINGAQVVTSQNINDFGGGIINNYLKINYPVTSTGTAFGALMVTGGVGIGDNLNLQNTLTIYTTAASPIFANNALVVKGGAGITGTTRLGSDLYTSGTIYANTLTSVLANLRLNSNGGSIYANGVDLLYYDANVWYVSDSGSDSNDGRRIQSAFFTVKHALSVAQSGDCVFVEAGTYSEVFPLTVPQGVTVKGAGLRATVIQPTSGTNTANCFLLNGETTISDLTIANFFKPGYAFKYATGAKITTKSAYVERVSVITKGSATSSTDPYGYSAGDAGHGVFLDGSTLDASSLEAAMLFNEVTFIVPNANGLYMTNGVRAELLNGFVYFADKAIYATAGTTGLGGIGRTKLKLSGIAGTFTPGDTLYYKDANGVTLASGQIGSVSGSYVYLNGPVYGFQTISDRTGKTVSTYGNAVQSTTQAKYGVSSGKFDGNGDYLEVLNDTTFQFGTGNYTVEGWVYLNSLGKVQRIFAKGTDAASTIRLSITSGNIVNAKHGNQTINGSTVLTTGQWYHVALSRVGSTNTINLFLNGQLEATTNLATDSVNNTDPVSIGGWSTLASDSLDGYLDEIRVSSNTRYTVNFTAPTGTFGSDDATVLLLHMNAGNNVTGFIDDATGTQNVYSTGSNPATATRITLADYHQFGAELRCIGSAAVFGNTGVTANGTGTDLKLIAFNVSHIGAGGDLSDDNSLVVQTNEIIQTNGGHVYYQTVDQSGDFRVGNSFLVNQRTGDVSFGNANVNLSNLSNLIITDGTNNTTILPTGITSGGLSLSNGTVASLSGNLTLDPAGTTTIVNSDLQVNGAFSVNSLNIPGTTNSTSTTTGAITVAGGVGIQKDVYVGGSSTSITSITGNAISVIRGGIGAKTLYIEGDGYIGNAKIVTTGTIGTVLGGNVPNNLYITTSTQSTGTQSGAFTVAGGVGIGGSIYAGGNIYQQGTQQVLSTLFLNLTGLAGDVTYGSGSAYINLNNIGVTSVLAGTDINVNQSTGTVTISDTSTLQSVTNRGATTNNVVSITDAGISTSSIAGNALQITNGGIGAKTLYLDTVGYIAGSQILTTSNAGGAFSGTFNNPVTVTSDANAINTQSGALQVVGGAGIGKDLYVGGNAYVIGDLYVDGSNFVINRTSLQTGDKTITLSTGTGSPNLALGSGLQVGYSTTTLWASLLFDGTNSWLSGANMNPDSDLGRDLGATNLRWANVNASNVNFLTITSTSTNASTSTIAGNTVITQGGIGAKSLYLSTDGWINGNRIITTGNLGSYTTIFDGGTIHNPLLEVDTTEALSTYTGALQVKGGAGIAKNLYVGHDLVTLGNSWTTGTLHAGQVLDSDKRVITEIDVVSGTGISASTVLTGPTAVLTITNVGVTNLSVGAGLSTTANTGSVTIVNTGVTTLIPGLDITVSAQRGDITINNVSTLESVTQRGATSTATIVINNALNTNTSIAGNALQVTGGVGTNYLYVQTGGFINGAQIVTTSTLNSFSGGDINNALRIANATSATSTQTGALQVVGGVGIGGSAWVGKDLHVLGDLYIDGNQTIVDSVRIQTGDKVLYLATATTTAGLAINSGIAVGPTTGTYAQLLFNGTDAWVSKGGIIPLSGTTYNLGSLANPWNNAYSANIFATSNTDSSGISSGALQSAGGLGVAKQATIGTYLQVQGAYNNTTTQASASIGTLGGAYIGADLNVVGTAWVGGNKVLSTVHPYDVVFQSITDSFSSSDGSLVLSGGLGVAKNVNISGKVGIANFSASTTTAADNALQVSGGIFADQINIGTIGTVAGGIIITTATIANYAFNGGTINKSVIINSATNATSTITGALQVTNGGAGIGGNVYIGGTLNVLTNTSTFKTISAGTATITTATITSGIFNTTTALISKNALYVQGGVGTGYLNVGTAGWINGSPIITAATINSFSGGTINNDLTINSPTIAISTITGAFRVLNGGIGIGGSGWFGGSLNVYDVTGTADGVFRANASSLATEIGSNTVNAPVNILVQGQTVASFDVTKNLGIGKTGPVFGIDLLTNQAQAGSANTITNLLNLQSSNWATTFGQDSPSLEITVTSYDSGSSFEHWISSGAQAVGTAQALVFAGGSYYNNSNLPTVTEWGRFTAAGNLVLKNQVSAQTSVVSSTNRSTATIGANALAVTGGIGGGYLYIANEGWIGTGKIITTANASAIAFNGGTITQALYINSSTQSTLPTSGALRVQGGAGIVGNLNVGANGSVAGYFTAPSITATNINLVGNTLSIGGVVNFTTGTDAGTGVGALMVAGGINIVKKSVFGDFAQFNSPLFSTSTIAGNAIQAPSGGIGALTLYLANEGWINGAQIVTTSTINNYSGGAISNPFTLTNNTQAAGTNSGALTVAGGVGIGGNMYVGGTAYFLGDLYVGGTQTFVNSTNIQTGDKVIYLSTSAPSSALASNSGISIGPVAGTYADWLFDGVSSWVSKGNINPSTAGGYNLGSAILPWNTAYVQFSRITGNTQSTTATNGTLIVTGGVGVSGNLNIGTSATVASGLFSLTTPTQNAFYVAGGIGAGYLNIANNGYVAGSPIITAANIAGYQFQGGTISNILTSTNTTSAFSTQTGALQIRGGVGIGDNLHVGGAQYIYASTASAVSTSGNALIVNGGIGAYSIFLQNNGYINGSQIVTAATLNSFSGGTINSSLTINSATNATSTTTGALQIINGGAGIGGNIYNGGIHVIGTTVNTNATLGTTGTGALQVLGGGSLSGNLNVGGKGYFSGYLGLNTNNPGAQLEVNGDVVVGAYNSSRVQISNGGGSNAIYEVGSTTVGDYRWQIGRDLIGIGIAGLGFINQNQTLTGGGAAVGAVSGVSSTLGFYTSNGSSLSLRGLIDGSGNMTIGQTGSPLAKLDVRGSFRLQQGNTEHVILSNNASQYVAVDFSRTATGAGADFRIGVNGGAGNFSPAAGAGDVNMAFSSNILFSNQNVYEVAKITPTGLVITTATVANSASSGALQVQGGAGVTGNFYVGSASSFTGAVFVGSALASTSSKAGNALVVTGGIGAASLWLDNPGWINGYQIVTTNNIGSFTGAFNGGTVTNPIYINNSANATSTSSGALYTTGGVGITQNLYVGGAATVVGVSNVAGLNATGILTVTNASSSTGSILGNAVQIGGGLGVQGTIYSGADHYISSMRVGLGGGAVSSNIALGVAAIASVATGGNNIGIGSSALTSLSSGQYNIGIGLQALQNAGATTNNVAVGAQAMNGTPGSNNVALGFQAGQGAQGSFQVAIGSGALAAGAGSNNIAIGYQAAPALSTGARNTVLGYQAGTVLGGGSQNVLLGYQAGQSITSGGNNVILGGNNGSTIATSNNNVIISDGAGNIVTSWNSSGLQTTPGVVYISNATSATSTTTGALQVVGGISTQGDIYARNIYANGALVGTGGSGGSGGSSTSTPYIVVTNATQAYGTGTTATLLAGTVGAAQVYGGAGVWGNLFVGLNSKTVINQAYDNAGASLQVGGAVAASGDVRGGDLYAAGGNNYLYYSQDWSVGATNWTKLNSSAGLNAINSPDGTTNGTKLTESGATGNHYFQQSGLSLAGPVTLSIFAKSAERTFVALAATVGGAQYGAYFNLSTGAAIVGFAPTYSATAKAELINNGWYRCQITIWAPPSATTTAIGIYSVLGNDSAINGTNTSFTGTGGNGVYIYGAQLDPGYVAGPYQPTTTTLFTNSNDIFAGGNLYIANTATVNNAQVVTTATLMTNLGLFGSTPNSLVINNATQSVSTVTGALQIINGGAGIGGNVYVGGSLYATSKSFLIDHPTKAGHKLQYGSLEGPENGVYVRGKLTASNTIELPDYWTGLVDESTITVDLTPIGYHQKLFVESIADNKVVVGNANIIGAKINCFYTVWAERKDIDKLNVEFKG